jgi:hypothetical protein
MRGASGEKIVLRDPASTPIMLSTIAATLGQIARFNGHTRRFYSVAEHSMHVSLLMQDAHGDRGAIYGLLHDAHEAYTGDIPSPIKIVLGRSWEKFEGAWCDRVRRHYGVHKMAPKIEADLKVADQTALATEMRLLMRVDDSRGIDLIEPDPEWDCLGGLDAGEAFFERAVQLGIEI